jgi:circadian clock protein KaiC
MTERLSTGTERLDDVLGGGFPKDAICLVIGLPGSGKTILAQQCVYANATAEHPALYLSTVSEPLEKMLRFGQTVSFFDPTVVGEGVLYDELGTVLSDHGLGGVLTRVRELIQAHRPGIIVIDSFKALHPYARSDGEFREFLHSLAGMVSAFPVTSLWVGEYDESEISTAPEFAVADAIVSMATVGDSRGVRRLRVRKLRGGDFLAGWHSYRISKDGISVFPRLADPAEPAPYRLGEQRLSSGIQALDSMLSEGYWKGASTLVAGPTGAGKTLMGLHFVFAGARDGEPGVIATMQENPSQLERICQAYGWSLTDGGVTLMYRSPVDLYLDEWVYELLDVVASTGATRVMVDSLNDLQEATADRVRFREYSYSLLNRLSRARVSVMMTYEVPELVGIRRLTEHGASHLADNVVVLQYTGLQGRVGRTLTVLKTRASSHDARVREFEITPRGILLTEPQPATEGAAT